MATGFRRFLVLFLGVLYGERRRLEGANSSVNSSTDCLLSSVACSYAEDFRKMERRLIVNFSRRACWLRPSKSGCGRHEVDFVRSLSPTKINDSFYAAFFNGFSMFRGFGIWDLGVCRIAVVSCSGYSTSTVYLYPSTRYSYLYFYWRLKYTASPVQLCSAQYSCALYTLQAHTGYV